MGLHMMRSLFALVLLLLASFSVVAPAEAKLIEITINKVGQKMTVRVDGRTEYVWAISSGARGYTTPSGSFKPFRLEKDHFSKEWDDAPMPNAIFFTERGHAIHGSFSVNSLGRPVSHGCVRLHPDNAAVLFALVQEAGLGNTRVVVKGGFFDFGYSPKRSFADVGNDIDKTIAKKRKPSGFSFFGNSKPKKVVKKVAANRVKTSDKQISAKKPAAKDKKIVVAAKKPADKAKTVVVATKKIDDKAKKVVDAKCPVKDGKKLCPKPPAAKTASNG
jgi:L,D-transpeptidase catalytic domain